MCAWALPRENWADSNEQLKTVIAAYYSHAWCCTVKAGQRAWSDFGPSHLVHCAEKDQGATSRQSKRLPWWISDVCFGAPQECDGICSMYLLFLWKTGAPAHSAGLLSSMMQSFKFLSLLNQTKFGQRKPLYLLESFYNELQPNLVCKWAENLI